MRGAKPMMPHSFLAQKRKVTKASIHYFTPQKTQLMATKKLLTASERDHILALLRQVYKDENICPNRALVRKVKNFLEEAFESGVALRDAFELAKVETLLETMLLASAEIGLRGEVFLGALLSAVVVDEAHREKARILFGDAVADVLDAFDRIALLRSTSTEVMKTDNFRNLFIAQAKDMRLVLFQIARSVNWMRRIKGTSNVEEQHRLSLEAAHLYAPLAHKLGLYTLKRELEDLSLKYLEHDVYYHIKEKLNATRESRDAYIEQFTAPIRQLLDAEGFSYHMKGRTKSIHSIWQKMKKQKCEFERVYDLFAIRIILDVPLEKEKEQCWKVFSMITDLYESNLKRLRDWLTVPKSNGYESLHITVLGPEDKWVEVQIRTERMDDVAEHGLAAHWRYKGVRSSGGTVDSWLADIRSALETGDEALLSNSLTTQVKAKNVYVFSPKGDLYRLPAGATVLDFAYLIHTGLGNKCTGAYINGRNVSIRQELHSGEAVEIMTSSTQTPKMEWTNFVVSSHARSKIRASVKELQARQGVLARELLERKLKNRKIEWDETILNRLVHKLGFKEGNDFYVALTDGRLDVNKVIEQYVDISAYDAGTAERAPLHKASEYDFTPDIEAQSKQAEDVLVIDQNLKGIEFQMAPCCAPVYGDDVFGFVTISGGIKIHRSSCPNAPALRERFGYRIVKARWAGKGGSKYPITLRVVGNDDLGILHNITSIISKEAKIMLRSVNIDSNDNLFSGIITLMVDDTQVLQQVIKKIATVRGVKSVTRT